MESLAPAMTTGALSPGPYAMLAPPPTGHSRELRFGDPNPERSPISFPSNSTPKGASDRSTSLETPSCSGTSPSRNSSRNMRTF